VSDKGFFSRWAQRKQQVIEEEAALKQAAGDKNATDASPQKTATSYQPSSDSTPHASEPSAFDNTVTTEAQPAPCAADGQADVIPDKPTAQTDTETDKPLSDDDMPDVAGIDGNSNVSAFFSEGVSQALRKQALKAMFLKPEFNIRDGMDDYDLNYADAPELAADAAAELRQWFKNKDPLNLKHDKESEAAVAATSAESDTADDANVTHEANAPADQPETLYAERSPDTHSAEVSHGDSPENEPGQNQQPSASDKERSADSTPDPGTL